MGEGEFLFNWFLITFIACMSITGFIAIVISIHKWWRSKPRSKFGKETYRMLDELQSMAEARMWTKTKYGYWLSEDYWDRPSYPPCELDLWVNYVYLKQLGY